MNDRPRRVAAAPLAMVAATTRRWRHLLRGGDMVTEPVPVDFHRFRVLYSDGEVIDFIASRDDSTLREHMLATHWGDKGPPGKQPKKGDDRRIAGVADLGLVVTYTPEVTEL